MSTRLCYIPSIKALGLIVSDKKTFSFFQICLCKACDPVAGLFLPIWASFEQNWQRFTRWCYIPNIKALGLALLDKKMFSYFPYISICKTCDPRAGPFLVPGVEFEQVRWRSTR